MKFPQLLFMTSLLSFACAPLKEPLNLELKNIRSDSKLSIHTGYCFNVAPGTSPCSNRELLDFVSAVKPKIIKVLDGFTAAAPQIKAVSPQTLVIGRIYYPDQEFDFVKNPEQEAERWWLLSQAKIQAAPQVDYWEGVNEPRLGSPHDMSQYAVFEVRRIQLLAKHGKAACIGNFSQGTPHINVQKGEFEYWRNFKPALAEAIAAKNPRGILCLHEYSMTPRFQDSTYWHVGRYRQVYEYLRQENLASIKLAITEFGIDSNSGPAGWKQQFTQNSFAGKIDAYISEMLWFDQEFLRKDDYVLGAMIYAHGIPNWENFDIAPLMPSLTARVAKGY